MGRITTTSINQHVRQIEAALSNARIAFFDLLKTIKAARDDLGEDIFLKDLADRLSISSGNLSKYLQIADCDPIIKKQKSLPPTLTTLYTLVQTHNALIKSDGADKADKAFYRILDKVDTSYEANDVLPFLKKAKEKLNKINKQNRENKLLSLSDAEVVTNTIATNILPISKLTSTNQKFRTIFIDPPKSIIDWASKSGVFSSDIAEKYPIAELRAPSTKITVEGFVYCPAHQIDGGLKILDASGFEFRDIIVPSSGHLGFELLRNEKVLIRGERGAASRLTLESGIETDLYGALTIAELIGSEPRVLIFASETYDGWTCAK